jgi:integrase/recombinase XerD
MLKLYRRHVKTCRHYDSKNARDRRNCTCPIWVQGTLGEKTIRESLKLTGWEAANKRIQEWESHGRRATSHKDLSDAWKVFIQDAEARHLSESVVRKYKLLSRQMETFARQHGIRFLDEFDVEAVGNFRQSWKDGVNTSIKKLERLRSFFRFAVDRNWITSNPASRIKSPEMKQAPTLPFSRAEMQKILDACPKYLEEAPVTGKDNGRRLYALVLLLRYSGLRVGDAIGLTADRLNGNQLFLYLQKTQEPVNVVLPQKVVDELQAIPRAGAKHFFWSGHGKLDSIVRSWQTRLRRLFTIAKIENGHPHRFRDTFAVELLLANPPTPIEEVSKLLGHTSLRITEKHYSPWNRARQEKLESHVKDAWKSDPFLQSGRYTPETLEIKKSSRRAGRKP